MISSWRTRRSQIYGHTVMARRGNIYDTTWHFISNNKKNFQSISRTSRSHACIASYLTWLLHLRLLGITGIAQRGPVWSLSYSRQKLQLSVLHLGKRAADSAKVGVWKLTGWNRMIASHGYHAEELVITTTCWWGNFVCAPVEPASRNKYFFPPSRSPFRWSANIPALCHFILSFFLYLSSPSLSHRNILGIHFLSPTTITTAPSPLAAFTPAIRCMF